MKLEESIVHLHADVYFPKLRVDDQVGTSKPYNSPTPDTGYSNGRVLPSTLLRGSVVWLLV